jgi:hypothetical protein
MSSKGTRITPVRIDPVLLEDVQSQIRSRNEHTKDEEWNLSDFIRVALVEKLKHYRRSRKKKSKRQGHGQKREEWETLSEG